MNIYKEKIIRLEKDNNNNLNIFERALNFLINIFKNIFKTFSRIGNQILDILKVTFSILEYLFTNITKQLINISSLSVDFIQNIFFNTEIITYFLIYNLGLNIGIYRDINFTNWLCYHNPETCKRINYLNLINN